VGNQVTLYGAVWSDRSWDVQIYKRDLKDCIRKTRLPHHEFIVEFTLPDYRPPAEVVEGTVKEDSDDTE